MSFLYILYLFKDIYSFTQELEQIEEHWRQESRDLVEMVTRLQEENRRLSEALQESRSDSQYSSKQSTNHFFPTNTML